MLITQKLRHNQEQEENGICKKHVLEAVNTPEGIEDFHSWGLLGLLKDLWTLDSEVITSLQRCHPRVTMEEIILSINTFWESLIRNEYSSIFF